VLDSLVHLGDAHLSLHLLVRLLHLSALLVGGICLWWLLAAARGLVGYR
jgi:hypothetical protein